MKEAIMMERENMKNGINAALLAGIMAIMSQFTIPMIGGVPITLQSFVCALAGGILGRKWGAIAMSLWLLLGVFGVPILTMGKAGPGIFVSPVGGYYVGFILMAWISGFRPAEKGHFIRQAGAGFAGLIACYLLGTIWFMGYFAWGLGKEMPLLTALTMTVIPFIPFDIVKVCAGVMVGTKIRQALVTAGYYARTAH